MLALRRRQNRGAERMMHEAGGEADDGRGEEASASASGGAALVDEGRRRLPFELTSSQNKGESERERESGVLCLWEDTR